MLYLPIVAGRTMAGRAGRLLFVLLLVVIAEVSCDGPTSPQPRGPDIDKPAGTATDPSDDQPSEENGECPADDGQVQVD